MTRLAALLVVALACARGQHAGPPAAAAAPTQHAIEVPGHGALAFELPAGWELRPAEPEEDRRTVELGPDDRSFVALLTVFPDRPTAPDAEPVDTARLFADLARRAVAPGAVEEDIELRELAGPSARGYWFEATDKALEGKPDAEGEYRHVLQGAAVVGDLLVAFTLLDNAPGPQRAAMLQLVRDARRSGAGAPPPGGARGAAESLEPDPDAQTVPYVARDRDGKVSVLVDLPGFRMFKPRASADGSATAVVGQAPDRELVVSLILRSGPGLDARGCRERDLAELRRSVPALTAVEAEDVAGQARLRYEVPAGAGAPAAQLHAHAFLARDGVCVNLHLSKADPAPGDPARLEPILASLRFGEKL